MPTEPAGPLDQALGVMSEWAFRIRCAPDDLERERGAVLEEWRATRNSAGRTQEASWRQMLAGSR